MNILICLKMISRSTYTDAFGQEVPEARLDSGNLCGNPADLFALELALRIRDAEPDTAITVLSMGPETVDPILREALSAGADRAVHICDPIFAGSDTIATAKALCAALRLLPRQDLIVCGRKAMDSETGHIAPQLAALTGMNYIPNVLNYGPCGKESVEFYTAGGEHVRLGTEGFPALISVINGPDTLRLPTIALLRKSRTAAVERLDGKALGLDAKSAGANASGTETIRIVESDFADRGGTKEFDTEKGIRILAKEINAVRQKRKQGVSARPIPAFPTPESGAQELWVVTEKLSASALGLIRKAEELAKERSLALRVIELARTGLLSRPAELLKELTALFSQIGPTAILFEKTTLLSDIAPAFAALTGSGITADCTALEWDERYGLLQIRPTFGGRRIAVNRSLSPPYVATVRRGVFGGGAITDEGGDDLETAPLVLSGGMGLGCKEHFDGLFRLAGKTGAEVGASRAAVAAGYVSYDRQIGQTGVSVRPLLYVAFGISGAVQHLSGILNAERVIAVNRDPAAPIHRFSDYSLIADAPEVLSALNEIFGNP